MVDIFSLFGGLGGGGPMAGVAPVMPMGGGVVANEPVADPAAPVPGAPLDIDPSKQRGNVLAVIDPARLAAEKATQAEAGEGLFDAGTMQAIGAGAGAGVGHSKWGAFAQGMAAGLNAQGKYNERRQDRDAKSKETAIERQLRLRALDRADRDSANREKYQDGMLAMSARRQNWAETPDDPDTPSGDPARDQWRNQNTGIRWLQVQGQLRGITGGNGRFIGESERQKRRAQLTAEYNDPTWVWNGGTRRPGQDAPAATDAGTTPAPAGGGTGATSATTAPVTTPAPATPGKPAAPKDKAEYDALPSGTMYTAPDLSVRRKP